ncbi:2-oxoglutarate receptor 1-like protein [Labeo rohita]|uniref:2-oxoglutarate receptor 1-like protein n=2 Tax=Labeo rohita TaxID=84645 RepID=A0A498NPK3_LABRO|nr:2-oxoglutarate receptor 1 [Labeo rohita]KAI2643964.1 2-oxoglutarate receptor 1 [Labeo rohita]RXN33885.1 2-oxoglutarate receptor 1-like protein [Labeo rohita]RXN38820.1 2-oxoglutarate receptor 1-like protein [Labeo rohita]
MINDSSDNCTNVDDLVKHYYLPPLYGAIFIVGVVGNITALLVYVVKLRPWKSSTIIMVNLIITDFLFMIPLPFLTYYYSLNDSWTLGVIMCRFTRFIFHFNLYGSILFLTCLAIFRYVAVVHPMHGRILKQKRWGALACFLCWTVAVAEVSPIFNLIQMEDRDNKTYCLDLASNQPEILWPYSWVLTVLGYLVPLIVVCVCYWRIMKVLKKGPHKESSNRVRARRLIMLVLTCFIVCFFPFHVLRALRIYTRLTPETNCMLDRWVHAAYIISRPIAAVNIIFNLPLYSLAGDCFKQAFVEMFKCDRLMPKTKAILKVAVISKSAANITQDQSS